MASASLPSLGPPTPPGQPPTLYLIDGYAQFFRAYHAIRTPMTSPVTKEPTNMTFGFIGMMLRLLRGEGKIGGRPAYIAVTLDVSGDKGTFRSQMYPEYKATRSEPPVDLGPQVDRCLKVLEAMNVPLLGAAGYEADDVIATIVTRVREANPGVLIRIISKDKDLKQLLEPGFVELFDIHTDEVIDAAALKADCGLDPPQIIDMLALMGDTSDNVPGVEGIGPKTAAELICQYGSLDTLIARASEIKGKRGERLRAAIDAGTLLLSRDLVTLRHDVPLTFDLETARSGNIRLGPLPAILRELGFNRYQDEVKALAGGPVGDAGSLLESPAKEMPILLASTPSAPERPRAPKAATALSAGPGLFDALEAPANVTPTRAANPHYRTVRTPAELAALLKLLRSADMVALDTETTSLHPRDAKLCGISLSLEAGAGWYIPVRSPESATHMDETTVIAALRPWLEDPAAAKCGHNLKYDRLILRGAGVDLRGVVFDSMIASFLIDASRSSHSLDALALALLGHTNISISELIGSGASQRTFDTAPVDQATQYAAEDADIALRLMEQMRPQLAEMGLAQLFDQVEMPLLDVLAELEWNGILVDPAELDRQRDRLAGQIAELRRQIDGAAMATIGRVFNPDSPKQLSAALFNKATDEEPGLGLKPVKKTKTGLSTDIEVLETLAQDAAEVTRIPGLIVDYRQLTKLVSTYLVALKEAINATTGRIHASFNQTVAVTGRIASSDPNLQNIPIRTEVGREIRKAFVAPPGRVFVSADYSQIELRLLAHLSQDPALIEAFEQGEDIHRAVAAQINHVPLDQVSKDQRAGAKMVNFGIVYGVTAFGLARRLGIPSGEASAIIDAYKKRFAGITTFLQECIAQAERHGYVETILKRRRPIPDITSNVPARRAFGERIAINSVVQGSAADLIKLAMIDLYRLTGPRRHKLPGDPFDGTLMLLQIHDELVFETPADKAQAVQRVIIERMEGAMKLSVPLKADSSIAANWFDGK